MPDLAPSASLPQTLDHAFDTFEAIRRAARRCEDQSPDLFAAFMSAATAADDGRDAVLAARTLPASTPGTDKAAQLAADGDLHEIADSIAARQPGSPPASTTRPARPRYPRIVRPATTPPLSPGRFTTSLRAPMTATLGDFLTIAGQNIAAAEQDRTRISAAAHAEVITELDRILTVIARYACDGVHPASGPATSAPIPTRQELTSIGIRLTLLHATQTIHGIVPAPGNRASTGHQRLLDVSRPIDQTAPCRHQHRHQPHRPRWR